VAKIFTNQLMNIFFIREFVAKIFSNSLLKKNIREFVAKF